MCTPGTPGTPGRPISSTGTKTTLLGIGNLGLFSLILWGSFKTPGFSGPTGGRAVLFVVAIYLSGAAIYFVSKAVRRQEGVDLDLAFKEIPPE